MAARQKWLRSGDLKRRVVASAASLKSCAFPRPALMLWPSKLTLLCFWSSEASTTRLRDNRLVARPHRLPLPQVFCRSRSPASRSWNRGPRGTGPAHLPVQANLAPQPRPRARFTQLKAIFFPEFVSSPAKALASPVLPAACILGGCQPSCDVSYWAASPWRGDWRHEHGRGHHRVRPCTQAGPAAADLVAALHPPFISRASRCEWPVARPTLTEAHLVPTPLQTRMHRRLVFQ